MLRPLVALISKSTTNIVAATQDENKKGKARWERFLPANRLPVFGSLGAEPVSNRFHTKPKPVIPVFVIFTQQNTSSWGSLRLLAVGR